MKNKNLLAPFLKLIHGWIKRKKDVKRKKKFNYR